MRFTVNRRKDVFEERTNAIEKGVRRGKHTYTSTHMHHTPVERKTFRFSHQTNSQNLKKNLEDISSICMNGQNYANW